MNAKSETRWAELRIVANDFYMSYFQAAWKTLDQLVAAGAPVQYKRQNVVRSWRPEEGIDYELTGEIWRTIDPATGDIIYSWRAS